MTIPQIARFTFCLGSILVSTASLAVEPKSTPIVIGDKGILIEVNQSKTLSKGQKVAFARADEFGDLTVIANGRVTEVGRTSAKVKIETGYLVRRPQNGDIVMAISPQPVFPDPKAVTQPEVPMFGTEEVPVLEPGYFSMGFRYNSGTLKSDSSNQSNSLKDVENYTPAGFQLEWFLDFLPSYGLMIQSVSGVVPVFAYNREEIPSTYSKTNIQIHYRTKPSASGIRYGYFLDSLFENFATENTDEYVIDSTYSSVGLGARLSLEQGDPFELKNRNHFRFHRLVLEGSFFPSVSSQDGVVSRGSSSSGSRTDFKLTASFNFGTRWSWWLSHFFMDISTSQSQMDLSFSGPTQSEEGGIYIIPEGGTASEKENIWAVVVGIRIDDKFGKLLKPRN